MVLHGARRALRARTIRFAFGCALAALLPSALAQVSTSCQPLVVVPGPGGGGLETPAITAPGSQVTISGNDCFQSGATYLWTPTNATTASLTTTSPPAGVSVTYTVRSTTASAIRTGSATLSGAVIGAPICTLLVLPGTTLAVGQQMQLSASCSPGGTTSFSWSGSDSVVTLVSGQNTPTVVYQAIAPTAANTLHALYMTPSNAAGRGPDVAVSFTVAGAVAPPPVASLAPQVSAGAYHACGLALGGAVKCWGRGDFGQLGNGQAGAGVQRSLPTDVQGLSSGAVAIAAGAFHSCALPASGGGAVCWGSGASGALGNNASSNAAAPVAVSFPGSVSGGIVAIAAGYEHSCALSATGQVLCWGLNDAGQVTGTPGGNALSAASAISGAAALALGQPFTCALTTAGGVKCWGDNGFGEIGSGSSASSSPPADVAGLSGVTAITAGAFHACAIDNVGIVRCWGRNTTGQLGDGSTADRRTPVRLSGQATNAVAVSAGARHTCALLAGGTVVCWGDNSSGQLGDGTTIAHTAPVTVPGLPNGIVAISAGGLFTAALASDGAVYEWGDNTYGQIGDGSLFTRISPRAVLASSGNGYLGLRNTQPTVPPQQQPTIPVAVSGSVDPAGSSNVTATIAPRAQDANTNPNVYAFGLAPASVAKRLGVTDVEPTLIQSKDPQGKATGDLCVLVQLLSSGQLKGINSISQLTPFLSNTLSAAGASFNLLNGVPTVTIAGSTICLGYGSSPDAMKAAGTSQCVLTIPGNQICRPQAPQSGWWWNPNEPGRGFSLEIQGANAFFASYLYDASGRATWLASTGPSTIEGSLFAGRLLAFKNGQTLTGAYKGPDAGADTGALTLSFTDSTHGTLVWPGGTIPIERFNFVPGGLGLAAVSGQPENGWWWNPSEGGRGFFLEWQGGNAFVASYMYDGAGSPVWYVAFPTTPNIRSMSSTWQQFGNGQTLTGAYKPSSVANPNVGSLAVNFTGANTATLTLPDGRQIPITRFRF